MRMGGAPPQFPNSGVLVGSPGMMNPASFYRNLDLLEDEPLYVNAKQYHRILKRRDARTRFEAQMAKLKKPKVVLLSSNLLFYNIFLLFIYFSYLSYFVLF